MVTDFETKRLPVAVHIPLLHLRQHLVWKVLRRCKSMLLIILLSDRGHEDGDSVSAVEITANVLALVDVLTISDKAVEGDEAGAVLEDVPLKAVLLAVEELKRNCVHQYSF